MKKYIVTGGAGFIGSALVRALLAQGDGRVEVIDNYLTGRPENLTEVRSRVVLHEADIRDYAAIAPAIAGADVVFHLAAIPSVPRSIVEPVPSHEVNIDGDAVLTERYGWDIPVLFISARKAAKHRINVKQLRRQLKEAKENAGRLHAVMARKKGA